MVENRDDCFYVIDAPYLPNSVTLASQIVDMLQATEIDTSYAATYFSHIGILDPNTKQNIFIPSTGEVIRVMALTDKVKAPWFAPAGINRSLIKKAKSVVRSFTAPERDILQLGRINPIVKFNTYGVDIFGQRTLLNGTTNNLLTKINVRRMLNYLKKQIRDIALTCLFEQNDQTNVNNFLDKANIVLSTIQRERGLNKYVLSVDNDNNTPENIDRGLMFFILDLYPTSATEGIGLTFNINPSDNTVKFTNA
jgi:phage tail sheath protein FI